MISPDCLVSITTDKQYMLSGPTVHMSHMVALVIIIILSVIELFFNSNLDKYF